MRLLFPKIGAGNAIGFGVAFGEEPGAAAEAVIPPFGLYAEFVVA